MKRGGKEWWRGGEGRRRRERECGLQQRVWGRNKRKWMQMRREREHERGQSMECSGFFHEKKERETAENWCWRVLKALERNVGRVWTAPPAVKQDGGHGDVWGLGETGVRSEASGLFLPMSRATAQGKERSLIWQKQNGSLEDAASPGSTP